MRNRTIYTDRGRCCGPALRLGPLAAAFALAVAACDTAELLHVEDPDIITPGSLTGVEALPTLRATALGDFAIAYSGSGASGSGGTVDGLILYSGMLGDELINTETFPTRIEVDQRNIQTTNATATLWFRNMHRARRSAEFAARKYREFAGADTVAEAGFPEVLALAGFTYLFFAENWCSGVPVSIVNDDGTFEDGPPLTTGQLLDSAMSKFDQALAAANALTGVSAGTKNARIQLAQVGRGRAWLDRGVPASAVAAVAGVPTTFAYLILHSENSTRQNNGSFNGVNIFERYGVADREGSYATQLAISGTGPGLPYRSDNDPRINWVRTGGTDVGFDRRTPQFDQRRYIDRKASVPLASGLDARLIEAEAAMANGTSAAYLPFLDALRAAPPSYVLGNNAAIPAMPALTDPVTPDGRIDQLFKERAYWLWLTAHRLSDMRRLMRQYGRTEAQVFPTGNYFKQNLRYDGNMVSFPIPFDEENNQLFTECLTPASMP